MLLKFEKKKSVSPLISMVLIILFLTIAINVVIMVIKPVLDRSKDTIVITEALENLPLINSAIKLVASEGEGSKRTITLTVTDGVYKVNATNDWIQFDYDLKSDMKLEGRRGDVWMDPGPVFLDYFNHYIEGTDAPAGWTEVSGNWSVRSGEYVQNSTLNESYHTYAGDSDWRDYTVEARTKVKSDGWGESTIIFRYQDSTDFYFAGLGSFNSKYAIGMTVNNVNSSLATGTDARTEVSANTWYDLKVDVSGSSISLYVDGALVLTASNDTFPTGSIGLRTNSTYAYFDNVKVKTGENKVRFVIPYSNINLNGTDRFPMGTHQLTVEHKGTNTTLNRPTIHISKG